MYVCVSGGILVCVCVNVWEGGWSVCVCARACVYDCPGSIVAPARFVTMSAVKMFEIVRRFTCVSQNLPYVLAISIPRLLVLMSAWPASHVPHRRTA